MIRDSAMPQLFERFGSMTETGAGFFGFGGPFFLRTGFLKSISISSGSMSMTAIGPEVQRLPGVSFAVALVHWKFSILWYGVYLRSAAR